jgi:TonB family protein
LLTAQNKPAFTMARISFNEYGDKDVMLERINQIKTTNIVKKTHTLMLSIVGVLLLTGISYAGGMGDTDAKHKGMKHENNVYPVMRIEPKYPVEAARNNVEGAVLLKFDINADGKTENIKVVNAKPAYVFDQEAITALSQWTYKVKNNQASRDYLVQLDFRMDDSSNSPIHLLERITVSK